MKAELILVGKTSQRELQPLFNDYTGRINHYMPFAVTVVSDVERIMPMIKPTDHVVLLDERGTEPRSIELAQWLQRHQLHAKRLLFVIGGPYGFNEALYARADEQLSLSRLTFSHQMVRVIFAEQLYRACTIFKCE